MRVKSSPFFFRPVTRAMLLGVLILMVLGALVPAPLEAPANPAHPPNPAKSAWFLLWIQELVSHGTGFIYLAVALGFGLVLLPWWPLPRLEHARWFPGEHRLPVLASLLAVALILGLTFVALLFRGPDWRLALWP